MTEITETDYSKLSLKEQSFKLAYSFASKYHKYAYFFDSFEDYVMSLTAHILTKLEKYNPELASFGTFAYAVFTNRVKQAIIAMNSEAKHATLISLDTPICSSDSDSNSYLTFADILVDESEEIFQEKLVNDMSYQHIYERIAKYLSKDFIEHYAYNKSCVDIAREKHVSKQSVNNRILNELAFIQHYIKTGTMLINNNKRLCKLAKELDALLPEINAHKLI